MRSRQTTDNTKEKQSLPQFINSIKYETSSKRKKYAPSMSYRFIRKRIIHAGYIAKDLSQPFPRRLCAISFLSVILLLPILPFLILSMVIGYQQQYTIDTDAPDRSEMIGTPPGFMERSDISNISPLSDATLPAYHNHTHDHVIPNIVIFTHYVNLLKGDIANNSLDEENLALARNIRNTLYLNPTSQIRFLTDEECMASIRNVMGENSTLLHSFQSEEKGMYKADICRGAALWETGGLYFDADIQSRISVWGVLDKQTEFVSPLVHRASNHKGSFFNAFIGVTKQNPIMKRYLQMFEEYYQRKRRVDGPLGVILLREAYDEFPLDHERSVLWQEVRYEKEMFQDVEPTVGERRACHMLVAIPRTRIAVFYSRVRGSRMCGGKESVKQK